MKKILFLAAAAIAFLSGCQGTVDPENDGKDPVTDTSALEGTITLTTDKEIIKADGEYCANLTVLLTDKSGVEHDVTKDVEIYCEGSDKPMETSVFKTTEGGSYAFYAMRGFDISNTVTVRALAGVPELPVDPAPASQDFHHRMMLLQHTGNECPNCPRLMTDLRNLASDQAYNTLYHHVAAHAYNESDKAYSSAAATVSKMFNPGLTFPWLSYDLTTDEGYFLEDIKEAIDERHKDSADAGVCASAVLTEDAVYVNVAVKSAVSSKYRVSVWLLEDGIHSVQSGADASWQNMHENCLRAMYGATKNECVYGKHIGQLESGETAEMIAALDIEEGWIGENCKVIVLVVAGNGDYDLVNCTVCPVGGSVSYEYN